MLVWLFRLPDICYSIPRHCTGHRSMDLCEVQYDTAAHKVSVLWINVVSIRTFLICLSHFKKGNSFACITISLAACVPLSWVITYCLVICTFMLLNCTLQYTTGRDYQQHKAGNWPPGALTSREFATACQLFFAGLITCKFVCEFAQLKYNMERVLHYYVILCPWVKS